MTDSQETKIHRDIDIGGETFALLVESHHGTITARTAVHRQEFARRIGGARFVKSGDVAEVGHLSAAMTWKCAAAFLPADGEKSVLSCPEGIPASVQARSHVLAAHLREVKAADGGVIFGPDMNNPEAVMDSLARQDDLRDHVTGLTVSEGGFSIDERGYTAHGTVSAIDESASIRGVELESATVQGFGAVGAHTALMLARRGITVRAVSTVHGALIAEGNGGLDVEKLFEIWDEGGDEALLEYGRNPPAGTSASTDPDTLLAVPCDVFVPAARTGVLATGAELDEVRATENPHCRDVSSFHGVTGARMIAQGANHPVTEAGEMWLEEQGVIVLPDFIANCGGLIGCFVEWAYRDELRADPGRIEPLHARTLDFIDGIVRKNVRALLASGGQVRQASEALARTNRQEMLTNLRAFDDDPGGHRFARHMVETLIGA